MTINWFKNAEIALVGAIAIGVGSKYLTILSTFPLLKEEIAGIKVVNIAFIFAGISAYNYIRDRMA